MKKLSVLVLILASLLDCSSENKHVMPLLIPAPLSMQVENGTLKIPDHFSVAVPETQWKDLFSVVEDGFQNLSNRKAIKSTESNALIRFIKEKNLDSLAYSIEINTRVTIKAGSYVAATMASATLLQLVRTDSGNIFLPKIHIDDKPENQYQGLMVDVARKPHNIETLKQIVDICYYYKIRFIQLHLSDDQSFTFPSTAYPGLATPGHSFSKNQLADLVSYATKKGITLIPEFDLPGHSRAMREAMPELFGDPELYTINIASPKVWKAIYTIVEEMMDVFYTSPYFHIGADEAYLKPLGDLPDVKKLIAERGYDDVHDLFLEFIVKMNDFIKAHGKKTLVWESFRENGSKHVTIPTDIIVFAWETLYQEPQSLIDNGYTIINASWKPLYITPGKRWNQQDILNWDPTKWDNHWKIAPSYNGLQVDKSDAIIGAQICSWEMSDEMEVDDIKYRIPVLAAKTWSLWRGAPENFITRYEYQNQKLTKLLFPAKILVNGLYDPDYRGVYWNKENRFQEEIEVEIVPNRDFTVYYTTNGSEPTINDQVWNGAQKFSKTTHLKAKIFDSNKNAVGYLNRIWEYHPLKMEIVGDYALPKNINIVRETYLISDTVTLYLTTTGRNKIRYSTTGKLDELSPIYKKPIQIKKTTQFYAAMIDSTNRPKGKVIKALFSKEDRQETLTTKKSVFCSEQDSDARYAVDGIVEKDLFWSANSGAPQWITVDVGEQTNIDSIKLYTYWDGNRYYQYIIELSNDNERWETVADFSKNTIIANQEGITHTFPRKNARYIRTTMLYNSANPGLHITEIRAYN